ncbi:hypothetical protein ACFLT9_14040, partial [Acidobacteriota bacterium]
IIITGSSRSDKEIHIDLPDIDETDNFPIGNVLDYRKERDYLRSTINVLQRIGLELSTGWDIEIRGNIPINSGTASSSALVVAWVKFLLEAAQWEQAKDPEFIAERAFDSEVAEFGEPGGRMDHYASALGGIVFIHFGKEMKLERLSNSLKTFVLADSMQRKNTTGTLGFIKGNVLRGISSVQEQIPDFSVYSQLGEGELREIRRLPEDERRLLQGTLKTRDLTTEGLDLFKAKTFDHKKFGHLLNEQQAVLRENIRNSTDRINGLLEASLKAGALGGKINGSGDGGCIFAYTPEHSVSVADVLNSIGAKAHIVHVDSGARIENE